MACQKEINMPHSLSRLRKLAGVTEDATVDADLDAQIDEFDKEEARENAAKKNILAAFTHVGLTPTKVEYNEYPERAAVVVLDDEPLGWSLNKLKGLFTTHLSEDYFVNTYGGMIEIHFKLSEAIDERS
jgi:hypothetical protein